MNQRNKGYALLTEKGARFLALEKGDVIVPVVSEDCKKGYCAFNILKWYDTKRVVHLKADYYSEYKPQKAKGVVLTQNPTDVIRMISKIRSEPMRIAVVLASGLHAMYDGYRLHPAHLDEHARLKLSNPKEMPLGKRNFFYIEAVRLKTLGLHQI